MMNKRGQSLGLALISALFVLIVGLTLVNFLMPEVTTFRANMGCASPNQISDGAKLLCLAGDISIPYFVVGIFSLAIGIVVARLTL